MEIDISMEDFMSQEHWFDGSKTKHGVGARINLISPHDHHVSLAFFIDFQFSNNHSEYEALILSLQLLLDMQILIVTIHKDSYLMLSQVSGEYRCGHELLIPNYTLTKNLLSHFFNFSLNFLVRENNIETNDLSQYANEYSKL